MALRIKNIAAIAALSIGLASPVTAQSELATQGLEKRISALQGQSDANPFELGALQTLRAVEKTLQTRYKYGLGDGLRNMPLLRVEANGMQNPFPETSTPDTLSKLIETFLTDMDAARTTLSKAREAGVEPFTMVVNELWFDGNLNARRDKGEGVIEALGPMLMGRRAARQMAKNGMERIEIRFDEADLAWLMAYTHMLSGAGNGYLAFDPTPVFAEFAAKRAALKDAPTLPEYYDLDAVRAEVETLKAEQEKIKADLKAVRDEQKPFNDKIRALRRDLRKPENQSKAAAINAEIKALRDAQQDVHKRQRELYRARSAIRGELRAAQSKLPLGERPSNRRSMAEFQPTIDAVHVAITALKQQPDKARIQATIAHWRSMIEENKIFWAAVEKETDNDREWIPNAKQTPALPVEIDPALADAWQAILGDAEAVLNGRLLIPHPLLPDGYGISLVHYELHPTPIDLIEMVTGVGFYEHAAKGPLITQQNWQRFSRLTNGRAGMFSLFFN